MPDTLILTMDRLDWEVIQTALIRQNKEVKNIIHAYPAGEEDSVLHTLHQHKLENLRVLKMVDRIIEEIIQDDSETTE